MFTKCFMAILLTYISSLGGSNVITSVLCGRQAKYQQIKWQKGREVMALILGLGPMS